MLAFIVLVAIALLWCWDSYDEMQFELDCAYRDSCSAMFDVWWFCGESCEVAG